LTTALSINGAAVTIRPFARDDAAGVARFAEHLPEHDLLFLGRDIKHARVIAAWVDAIAAGEIESLVAIAGDRIVATDGNIADLNFPCLVSCELMLVCHPDPHGV